MTYRRLVADLEQWSIDELLSEYVFLAQEQQDAVRDDSHDVAAIERDMVRVADEIRRRSRVSGGQL